jgi:hypothetical protein
VEETIFGKLIKGDKFTVEGDETIWIKVVPVTKGCCKNKVLVYSAVSSKNGAETEKFLAKQKVFKILE